MRPRGRVPAAGAVALALGAALSLGVGAQGLREPTTRTGIGIFYQPDAPQTASLWRDGDRGERLSLRGRVIDRLGQPVVGARVELWHADAAGGVDESRYRALQITGRAGRFGIRTVLPGHIERARDNIVFGPRHIHVVVTHAEHSPLISLILFKGDPRLAGSPYPELAIALEKARTEAGEVLFGRVELVFGD